MYTNDLFHQKSIMAITNIAAMCYDLCPRNMALKYLMNGAVNTREIYVIDHHI
jgi:hypothetical protein